MKDFGVNNVLNRLTWSDVAVVALLAIPASEIPDTAPRSDPLIQEQMQAAPDNVELTQALQYRTSG